MPLEPGRSLLSLASFSQVISVSGIKSRRTVRVVRRLPNHLLRDIGYVRTPDGVLRPM